MKWRLIVALTVLLLLACLLSVITGAAPLDIHAALSTDGTDRLVLVHERIPRTVLAATVGAALSASGLTFQAILSNPLADPYIIGVSGGAAVGGTLAMVLPFMRDLGAPAVSALAFLGGLSAVLLTWHLARDRTGRMRAYEVLLMGVVFNAFASAFVMFMKSVVRAEKAQEMLLWLMGTLSSDVRGFGAILASVSITVLGLAVLFRHSPALNALTLGEEDAASMGVDVERTTKVAFVASSLLVAAAVSVAGLIGFVGLIVPHAVRLISGLDHRVALPASAMLGAAFLVLADLATRTLFPVFETEAPVGILTALIGGPVFVWLLKRESP